MRVLSEKKLRLTLPTARIEALTDGVFAIAMTLLVLNFSIVETGELVTSAKLHRMLSSLWPHFVHYVQSFLILAVFWTKNHQQFHFIKRSDRPLLWINLACLLFVCLIPFSTSLMSDYGHIRSAALIFELNLFVAGSLFWLHWIYATGSRRLVDRDLDPLIVAAYSRSMLVVPAIAILAMALSCFHPRWGTNLFFLVPLAILYLKR